MIPIAIAHVNILCDTNLFQRFLLENSGSSGNVRVKEFDGPPVIPFDNNEVATAIGEGRQAVNELDCYVSSPEARNGPWYRPHYCLKRHVVHFLLTLIISPKTPIY